MKESLNLMAFIRNIIYLKKKNTAYVVHLDEYESVGTHWIALYVNNDNVKFFDSFEVECIFKKSNNS